MYGDSLLIAPQTDDSGTVKVWLPEGDWYDYASKEKVSGGRTVSVTVSPGELPIYVKAGGILPFRDYAQSTAFIDKSHLGLTVFVGEDGSFELIEDDDHTEAYRDGAARRTRITYQEDAARLMLSTEGSFESAPTSRRYTIRFVGIPTLSSVLVNGQSMTPEIAGQTASVTITPRPVDEPLEIVFVR
jgi:alpha-D-xyloside xylohydrolase